MLHWIVPKSDFRNILIFYEIEPCTHCHTIIYLPSAYDYIYRPSFISRIKPCHCLSVLLWEMVHAFLKSLSTYNLNLILKKDFKLDVIFVKKKILSTNLLTKVQWGPPVHTLTVLNHDRTNHNTKPMEQWCIPTVAWTIWYSMTSLCWQIYIVEEALDKYNIIPNFSPKSWDFYTIRGAGMGNDCILSFMF